LEKIRKFTKILLEYTFPWATFKPQTF